jgi:hypothetical protein
MHFIIYLALVAALVAAIRLTPGRATLAVYLPVLLLLPDCYHAFTPGLPDPSFNQAAILPILAAALLRYGSRWKPSVADFLAIGFATSVAWSEYVNAGYQEAQNLIFAMMTGALAPYLLARLCIARERLHVAAARTFAGILFALAVIGLFEAKFGYNPFHAVLGAFFPGQGGWVTTFRHGIARVAGPYSHAILAGIMMVMAYRLQRWLEWGGHWEPRFVRVPLPWNKARVMSVWLFLGSLMTVARGPWIGGLVGGALAYAGRSRQRRRTLALMAGVVAAAGILGGLLLASYLDIQPGMAITASQESALYRKVLMEKYLDIAVEHAWLGWGRNTWPKVAGMESIDNYYLLLSLMHGLLATALLLGLMLWMALRLLRHGLTEPAGHNSLSFCFLGMIVSVIVSLATVYLGENVLPALFFVLGWAEGFLRDPGSDPGLAPVQAPMAQPARFRRVMA